MLARELGHLSSLAPCVVGIGREAGDAEALAAFLAQPILARPLRVEAVRDDQHRRDPVPHELETPVEPLVLRAGEDDDSVRLPDSVLDREEHEPEASPRPRPPGAR